MLSRKKDTSKYESTSESDTLDALTRKLASDLRLHVRKLELTPLFTREWLSLVDSVEHVSNIAMMEHRLPRSDGDSTLWEGDELTVRFMLEEGKLNFAIRILDSFSEAVKGLPIGEAEYAAWLQRTARTCGLQDGDEMRLKLLQFEQALGTLIRCAMDHVEAVQTTDLHTLMRHIESVLVRYSLYEVPAEVDFEQTQGSLVLRYLAAVFSRVETVGEERLLPLVEQHRLVRAPAAACGYDHIWVAGRAPAAACRRPQRSRSRPRRCTRRCARPLAGVSPASHRRLPSPRTARTAGRAGDRPPASLLRLAPWRAATLGGDLPRYRLRHRSLPNRAEGERSPRRGARAGQRRSAEIGRACRASEIDRDRPGLPRATASPRRKQAYAAFPVPSLRVRRSPPPLTAITLPPRALARPFCPTALRRWRCSSASARSFSTA